VALRLAAAANSYRLPGSGSVSSVYSFRPSTFPCIHFSETGNGLCVFSACSCSIDTLPTKSRVPAAGLAHFRYRRKRGNAGSKRAVGFAGALMARFHARGMALGLLATAVAQMLVPVIALLIWQAG
jgi:hypothetical protein